MNRFACSFLTLVLPAGLLLAQDTNPAVEPKAAAYLRTLNERATKIVTTLGVADAAKSNHVHAILVQQYRALNDIHFVRDIGIQNARAKAGDDKPSANAAIQAIHAAARPKLDKLHAEFLAHLSAGLSPGQVDRVKDGMTYGVLPVTYNAYLKSFPDLTEGQKAQIKAWLTEARELAMDGSTSEEKHAVFGKTKGRINNYLVKAGYNLKQGGENLRQASRPSTETKPK
jgi:hypothetical protein